MKIEDNNIKNVKYSKEDLVEKKIKSKKEFYVSDPMKYKVSKFLEYKKDAFNLFSSSKELYKEPIRKAIAVRDMLRKLPVNKNDYYYNSKKIPTVHANKIDARILEELLRAVALGEEKLAKALLETS